jgi:hypothetical protein
MSYGQWCNNGHQCPTSLHLWCPYNVNVCIMQETHFYHQKRRNKAKKYILNLA